ncbi:MAG: glutamate-5-semialdehyde dehydrogenase [Chthoniobacterales bacterium]
MSLADDILQIGQRAREASRSLARCDTDTKNSILQSIADGLEKNFHLLVSENKKDLEAGEKRGLSKAMLDRLRLDEKRVSSMAVGLREVASLPDPTGEVLSSWTQPNGIRIEKVRTPIGVIGIIYESRPNVTSDATGLCLKTGNAVILRGGSEAIHSNLAIAKIIQESGATAGLPDHAVQLIPTTDREAVSLMAKMDAYIDLIIPRGGHALIERVVSEARMPVIKHYHGVCNIHVDTAADLEMATSIVVNSKCQRPGVCNALENLTIDASIAKTFLPKIAAALEKNSVELRGDDRALPLLGSKATTATEEDWTTEYLDLILSIKVVDSLDEAIAFINQYGSHHSDGIVTREEAAAEKFLQEVDSATVYWNASTRFTDGNQFGFGAEIGISTDKLHARGPMALPELTSYKYRIIGTGQIRE